MESNTTNIKFENCFKALRFAMEFFQDFLSAETSSDTTSYYRAQNYLNEGKTIYNDIFKEIRELIGCPPADATPAFKKWKTSFLEKMGILSQNSEFAALKLELHNDEFLLRFLKPEEIDTLLVKHFESQQSGKRILSNIKARMIFDKIQSLLDESETIANMAKEKIYQLR
jgi:hypothetical protein